MQKWTIEYRDNKAQYIKGPDGGYAVYTQAAQPFEALVARLNKLEEVADGAETVLAQIDGAGEARQALDASLISLDDIKSSLTALRQMTIDSR